MQKQYRISAGQLFSILFVNRSVIMLTHNTLLGGGENMVDNILSALLALVLNFVLILPLYFLHRRNPQENVLETGERLVGKPGAILLAVFYGLYFMAIDSYYLSFFQIFLNNIMEPLMPVWLCRLSGDRGHCPHRWICPGDHSHRHGMDWRGASAKNPVDQL